MTSSLSNTSGTSLANDVGLQVNASNSQIVLAHSPPQYLEKLCLSSLDAKGYFTSKSYLCTLPPNPNPKRDLSILGSLPPTLSFPVPFICEFLESRLLKEKIIRKVVGNPFIIGGASMQILDRVRYADQDICFYVIRPDFPKILHLFADFIRMHLWSKYAINAPQDVIIEAYLYNKVIFKDENHQIYGSYIGLGVGGADFKFYIEPQGWFPQDVFEDTNAISAVQGYDNVVSHRYTVSAIDGFHISFCGNVFFCIDGNRRCTEAELKQALTDLRVRVYKVKEPQNVRELSWRLFLQISRGFRIHNSNEMFQIAFEQLQKEYPLDKQMKSSPFRSRLEHFLQMHYPNDRIGKAIGFLSFLFGIEQGKDAEAKLAYSSAIANAWLDMSSTDGLLLDFARLLAKLPHKLREILLLTQGIFFTAWVLGEKKLSSQIFATRESLPPESWHLKLHHDKGHYLTIQLPPDELVSNTIAIAAGLREVQASDVQLCVQEIAQAFNFGAIELDASMLLKAFGRAPLVNVISNQFPHIQACNAFVKALKGELQGIVSQESLGEWAEGQSLRQHMSQLTALKEYGLREILIFIRQRQNRHELESKDVKTISDFLKRLQEENGYLSMYPSLRSALIRSLLKISLASLLRVKSADRWFEVYQMLDLVRHWSGRPSENDEQLNAVSMQIASGWLRACGSSGFWPKEPEVVLRCLKEAVTVPWDPTGLAIAKEQLFKILQAIVTGENLAYKLMAAEIAERCLSSCILCHNEHILTRQLAAQLIYHSKETVMQQGEALLLALSHSPEDSSNYFLKEMCAAFLLKSAKRTKARFTAFLKAYASLSNTQKEHPDSCRRLLELSQESFEPNLSSILAKFIMILAELNLPLADKCFQQFQQLLLPDDTQKCVPVLIQTHLNQSHLEAVVQAFALWSLLRTKAVPHASHRIIAAQVLRAVLQQRFSRLQTEVDVLFNFLSQELETSPHFTLNDGGALGQELLFLIPLIPAKEELLNLVEALFSRLIFRLLLQPNQIDEICFALLQKYMQHQIVSPQRLMKCHLAGSLWNTQSVQATELMQVTQQWIKLAIAKCPEKNYLICLNAFKKIYPLMDDIHNQRINLAISCIRVLPNICTEGIEDVIREVLQLIFKDYPKHLELIQELLAACQHIVSTDHVLAQKIYVGHLRDGWHNPATCQIMLETMQRTPNPDFLELIEFDLLYFSQHASHFSGNAHCLVLFYRYFSTCIPHINPAKANYFSGRLSKLWSNTHSAKLAGVDRGKVINHLIAIFAKSGSTDFLQQAYSLFNSELCHIDQIEAILDLFGGIAGAVVANDNYDLLAKCASLIIQVIREKKLSIHSPQIEPILVRIEFIQTLPANQSCFSTYYAVLITLFIEGLEQKVKSSAKQVERYYKISYRLLDTLYQAGWWEQFADTYILSKQYCKGRCLQALHEHVTTILLSHARSWKALAEEDNQNGTSERMSKFIKNTTSFLPLYEATNLSIGQTLVVDLVECALKTTSCFTVAIDLLMASYDILFSSIDKITDMVLLNRFMALQFRVIDLSVNQKQITQEDMLLKNFSHLIMACRAILQLQKSQRKFQAQELEPLWESILHVQEQFFLEGYLKKLPEQLTPYGILDVISLIFESPQFVKKVKKELMECIVKIFLGTIFYSTYISELKHEAIRVIKEQSPNDTPSAEAVCLMSLAIMQNQDFLNSYAESFPKKLAEHDSYLQQLCQGYSVSGMSIFPPSFLTNLSDQNWSVLLACEDTSFVQGLLGGLHLLCTKHSFMTNHKLSDRLLNSKVGIHIKSNKLDVQI